MHPVWMIVYGSCMCALIWILFLPKQVNCQYVFSHSQHFLLVLSFFMGERGALQLTTLAMRHMFAGRLCRTGVEV